MDISIKELFSDIIERLKKNERPRIKLSDEQLTELVTNWSFINKLESLESTHNEHLTAILCVLDHATNTHKQIERLILDSLIDQKYFDTTTSVYLHSIAAKHIIEHRFKNGDRLEHEFLVTLDKLLDQKKPENLEWTLRLIEQCGPQSIMLKQKVLSKKPSIFGILNKHNKSVKQLIEFLEKRWSPPNGTR